MQFESSLENATLIKRYKRFLADVTLDGGEVTTVHCPNTGSMRGCADEGWRVAIRDGKNPKRKLKYTWEMVHNGESWIVVNTNRANVVALEAIEAGLVPGLESYDSFRREVKYGKNSRIDILATGKQGKCYIEVKSVTLLLDDKTNAFPDAVTARGTKHLQELGDMVEEGHRAMMLYVIMREDGQGFRVASEIDPTYDEALKTAKQRGVEVQVLQTKINEQGIIGCACLL